MGAAAVVVMRQNRYMRRFADAGATGPQSGKTLSDLGCRDSWIFRRMVRFGVFVPCGDDRFYIDLDMSTQFVKRRRMRAIVFLTIALIVALMFAFA